MNFVMRVYFSVKNKIFSIVAILSQRWIRFAPSLEKNSRPMLIVFGERVSNTPLYWALSHPPILSSTAFQFRKWVILHLHGFLNESAANDGNWLLTRHFFWLRILFSRSISSEQSPSNNANNLGNLSNASRNSKRN